jgi:hypothetical protein
LPRHLFDEQGLAEWAEGRGVLVKAIEDVALGTASVYRALESPLPAKLPYAGKELQEGWIDLVARIMPFDLVLDEQTADGQPARISRNSVAGSWGAVAGNLRYFADRFGVARAAIEGTTLPYDLIRRYARRGNRMVELGGPRKHRGLQLQCRLSYFGFELEAEVEPLPAEVPEALGPALRTELTRALLAGETTHPNQARIRRGAALLGELWRRSAGTLAAASPDEVRRHLAKQLEGVSGWDSFLSARVDLDPGLLVSEAASTPLMSLPASVRVLGDVVPLSYEITEEGGVVRIMLREGQARRLNERDLPRLDRPIRFAVVRGNRPSLEADTIEGLSAALRADGPGERGRRAHHGRRRRCD